MKDLCDQKSNLHYIYHRICITCPEQYYVYNTETFFREAYIRIRGGRIEVHPCSGFDEEIEWDLVIFEHIFDDPWLGEIPSEQRDTMFAKIDAAIYAYWEHHKTYMQELLK